MITRRRVIGVGILAALILAATIGLLVAGRGRHGRPARLTLRSQPSEQSTSSASSSPSTTTPPSGAGTASTAPRRGPTGNGTTSTTSRKYTGPRGGIAFIDRSESPSFVQVMRADGGGGHRIATFDPGRTTNDPKAPWFGGDGFSGVAWNPAGDLLAVSSSGKYGGGLEVMRPDGTERRTIVHGATQHASFSPDGHFVVFHYPVSYVAPPQGYQSLVDIVGVDGSSQHHLLPANEYGQDPAWSPDGRDIVFVRVTNGGNNLALIHPDGTDVRDIAGTRDAQAPSWSRDGTWIAFAGYRNATNESDIFKVHPDGSGLTKVTDNHDRSDSPSWSPNGDQLVMTKSKYDAAQRSFTPSTIWIVSADGATQGQMPAGEMVGPAAWG